MEGAAWGIVFATTRSLYVPRRWRRRQGAERALADLLKCYPPGHLWRTVLRAERVPLAGLKGQRLASARLLDSMGKRIGPPDHGCLEPGPVVLKREAGHDLMNEGG